MFHGKLDTGQTDVEISVVFGETPLSPVPAAHRLSAAVGAVQTEQSQPPFWICTADPRPRSGPFCHLWLWTGTFCRATRDAKTPGLGLCVYRFFFDRNQSRNLQTDLPRPPPEPSTNPEHPVPPDQNLQTELLRPTFQSRPVLPKSVDPPRIRPWQSWQCQRCPRSVPFWAFLGAIWSGSGPIWGTVLQSALDCAQRWLSDAWRPSRKHGTILFPGRARRISPAKWSFPLERNPQLYQSPRFPVDSNHFASR